MAIEVSQFCEYAQIDINDAVEQGRPLSLRQTTGLLSALLSTQNVSASGDIQAVIDPGTGHTKFMDIRFTTPEAEADSVSNGEGASGGVCEAGEPIVDLFDRVEIDLVARSRVIELSEAQMRTMCEKTFSERRAKYIQGMLDSITRKINSVLIGEFFAGVGGFIGGIPAGKSIDVLDAGPPISVIADGEIEMMQDYTDSGAVGKPLVIGMGNMYNYVKRVGIGCCNQTGMQVDQLAQFDFYYDNQILSVLGGPSSANEFFVLQPGAANFLSANRNAGDFRRNNDQEVFDIFVDPVTGLTFDFYQVYVRCPEATESNPDGDPVYRLSLKLNFGLWQMPLTLFKATDNRFEVNFNFMYEAAMT